MKYLDNIVATLIKRTTTFDKFLHILNKNNTFYNDVDLEFELLISNGFPIEIIDENIIYKPAVTNIKDQVFCIVDIETTYGKPNKGQVLEIGAVKYKDGEILDKFDSLIYCKDVPKNIEQITNITTQMVQDAPLEEKVLEEFKIFLADDVFVAHNIKFDYNFISESFDKFDLGQLANAKLCTIDLAKRVIDSEKYGLQFLKELLNIQVENHHRAYSDAQSCAIILERCIKDLPKDIDTSLQLIEFSKSDNIIN